MLRKSTDEDISNEELETIINPFYDNYHNYVEEYVMPEVIAFYIASSFYRNAMWEATFLQHYNSASDMFNLYDEDDNLLGTAIAGLNELKKDVVYDFKALGILKADDVEKVDH